MTVAARKPAKRTQTRPPGNGGFGDNQELTPNREIEAGEYQRIVLAFVRALAKRGQAGDIQALIALAQIRKDTAGAMHDVAVALKVDHGYSFGEIGRAFGITRQAAQQR